MFGLPKAQVGEFSCPEYFLRRFLASTIIEAKNGHIFFSQLGKFY